MPDQTICIVSRFKHPTGERSGRTAARRPAGGVARRLEVRKETVERLSRNRVTCAEHANPLCLSPNLCKFRKVKTLPTAPVHARRPTAEPWGGAGLRGRAPALSYLRARRGPTRGPRRGGCGTELLLIKHFLRDLPAWKFACASIQSSGLRGFSNSIFASTYVA
ncbi:hypothetical protein EVAR_95955_1 [Eumeta japonica]|uniref:Uncharacterized protein n=1 Tax=Eumeta variegata TaxID=151549 RepID=A0A4C1V7L6_EUMVA|nr:hypothetical protein EVAR_95955_1 [Eumeta japonica]